MGIRQSLTRIASAILPHRAELKMTPMQESIWRDIYGGAETKTGASITWATSLEVTAVLRCAVVYYNTLGSIPFKLYRRVNGRGIEKATDHPLYDIVRTEPNSFQDSLQWRGNKAIHLAMTGNAYDLVSRNGGEIIEFIPLEPGIVRAERSPNLRIRYWVRNENGSETEYPPSDIWHWRGPAWNTWTGMDRVRLIREAIALASATESSHSHLHRNGLQTTGVFSVEGALSVEQYKQLVKWIEDHEKGKPLILDREGKWLSQSMTGVDAEHLPSRKFQVEEICRGLGVLPVMAGYTEGTTSYASVEQMLLAHAIHTARPLWRSFEESADRWLLTRAERIAGYYFKFSDGELLRGDAAARAAYYSAALGAGGSPPWLTQNEVREFEELAPSLEPYADKLARGTNPEGERPGDAADV
jgi:HK97 family phage portal protein